MKRKHQKILEAIFAHPVSANVQWRDIEALLADLGAVISEREGSCVALYSLVRYGYFIGPIPRLIPIRAL